MKIKTLEADTLEGASQAGLQWAQAKTKTGSVYVQGLTVVPPKAPRIKWMVRVEYTEVNGNRRKR